MRNGAILNRNPIRFNHNLLVRKFGRKNLPAKRLRRWASRARKVRVEKITYISDGLRVMGFLVSPRKRAGKSPAIIFNRGGSLEFGNLYPFSVWGDMAWLAENGYVVVGSQYRGNEGSEGREQDGGSDVHDVLNLVPLLRRLQTVDMRRIGMTGWSRGGMMTYQALKTLRNIRAAVVGGAPTDYFQAAHERPEMAKNVYRKLIPGTGPRYRDEFRKRSAIFWPGKIAPRTPILILHGTADWRVPASHSIRLAAEFQRLRRPYRLVLFEGGDHGISEYREEVGRLELDWLNRFVRDREPLPNTKPHGE